MTYGLAKTSRVKGRFPGPRPDDVAATYAILDAGTGNHAATQDMLRDRRWPGYNLAGPSFPDARIGGVVLAQAATMPGVMTDAGILPRFPSIGEIQAERLAGGALRLGTLVITAAALMQEVDKARERAEVEGAFRRFGLDRTQAADVLAARAYVWTRWMAPLSFPELPFAGKENEAAAEAVLQYERTHPGTAGLATHGYAAAIAAIDMLIHDAVNGDLGAAEPLYRTSSVAPALSTSSTRARGLVSTSPLQVWQAHHLIPFNVMARLPVSVQAAVATSGWMMDSVENLIALPANLAAFIQPPNLRTLPMHRGSHAQYDADVASLLAPLRTNGATLAASALRTSLRVVERTMRAFLFARRYHPRLS